MPVPHSDPYHDKVWKEIDDYARAKESRGLISRIGGSAAGESMV